MDKPKIILLRLNHRIERDKRASTHLFLAARALGVSEAFYSGEKDAKIEEINNIDNLVALCPTCHWELDHGYLVLFNQDQNIQSG